jgi:hypothetical protein
MSDLATPAARHPGLDAAADGAELVVQIVELKWLLAGHGVRLHVERLQTDREYARRILAVALGTGHGALRAAAEKLRLELGLAEP